MKDSAALKTVCFTLMVLCLVASATGRSKSIANSRLQTGQPATGVVDLEVTCRSIPRRVISPGRITYVVKVTNRGPQAATEVGLVDYPFSPDTLFVSVEPSQGVCEQKGSRLDCELGTMPVAASATIRIVVKPNEGTGSFPRSGKIIVNRASVGANEKDGHPENDSTVAETLVFPDRNLPPIVAIASPKIGAMFVGPAIISLEAIASDTDGVVRSVDFFDSGNQIGRGSRSGRNRFVVSERDISFGQHSFVAVATDDKGRQNLSPPVDIIVNGSASVHIGSPMNGSLIRPGSDVTIITTASHPSNVITRVELFANRLSLGEALRTGPNEYRLTLSNIERTVYPIVAVATDGSGSTTTSLPVTITANNPPKVSITKPTDGTTISTAAAAVIIARAGSPNGEVRRVDFYANSVLIGSDTQISPDPFVLTWRRPRAGAYYLTAVATDLLGTTTESIPVRIRVRAAIKQIKTKASHYR